MFLINYSAIVEVPAIISSVLITGLFYLLVEVYKRSSPYLMDYLQILILPLALYFVAIFIAIVYYWVSFVLFVVALSLTILFVFTITLRIKYDIIAESVEYDIIQRASKQLKGEDKRK